jgi:hypothetical protein
MRARNLKPSIFRNELLAVADPLFTVLFEGLWCLADRAGRLEDRPAKIHLEVNPGRAFESTVATLGWLAENGFILRYEASGQKFIQVVNFEKHQNPHVKEPHSTIPAPDGYGASPVQISLTPDSGLLTPDSPNRHASLPVAEWDEWLAHRKSKRWPCDPTTLQKQLNILAKHPTGVQREILDTSIQAGWQGLFPPKANGKPAAPAPKPRVEPTAEQLTAAQRQAAEDNKRQLAKLGLRA